VVISNCNIYFIMSSSKENRYESWSVCLRFHRSPPHGPVPAPTPASAPAPAPAPARSPGFRVQENDTDTTTQSASNSMLLSNNVARPFSTLGSVAAGPGASATLSDHKKARRNRTSEHGTAVLPSSLAYGRSKSMGFPAKSQKLDHPSFFNRETASAAAYAQSSQRTPRRSASSFMSGSHAETVHTPPTPTLIHSRSSYMSLKRKTAVLSGKSSDSAAAANTALWKRLRMAQSTPRSASAAASAAAAAASSSSLVPKTRAIQNASRSKSAAATVTVNSTVPSASANRRRTVSSSHSLEAHIKLLYQHLIVNFHPLVNLETASRFTECVDNASQARLALVYADGSTSLRMPLTEQHKNMAKLRKVAAAKSSEAKKSTNNGLANPPYHPDTCFDTPWNELCMRIHRNSGRGLHTPLFIALQLVNRSTQAITQFVLPLFHCMITHAHFDGSKFPIAQDNVMKEIYQQKLCPSLIVLISSNVQLVAVHFTNVLSTLLQYLQLTQCPVFPHDHHMHDALIARWYLSPDRPGAVADVKLDTYERVSLYSLRHTVAGVRELWKNRQSKQHTVVPAGTSVDMNALQDDLCLSADLLWKNGGYIEQLQQIDVYHSYIEQEMRFAQLLAEMQATGVPFQPATLRQYVSSLQMRLDEISQQAQKIAGMPALQLTSPLQVKEALFTKLGLTTQYNKSTGVKILRKLIAHYQQHQPTKIHFVHLLMEFRQLHKLLTTYILPLIEASQHVQQHHYNPSQPKDAYRLFATWNQTSTDTGRLSTSNPNIQALPNGDTCFTLDSDRSQKAVNIRNAFVARDTDHVILCVDYRQMEMRLAAHFSKDPHLIEIFGGHQSSQYQETMQAREAMLQGYMVTSGSAPSSSSHTNDTKVSQHDVYRHVAKRLFSKPSVSDISDQERSIAKTISLGIIYGMGAKVLAERTSELGTGTQTRSERVQIDWAKKQLQNFKRNFGVLTSSIDSTIQLARNLGYVQTASNRRRYLKMKDPNESVRASAERKCFNTVIQGSAADIMKQAMIRLRHTLGTSGFSSDQATILMSLHDEVVLDVHRDCVDSVRSIVEMCMSEALQDCCVPLTVKACIGSALGSVQVIV
jgi:DNA polymerase I-like protein with 3'-5' exonuclease and polymerase domains